MQIANESNMNNQLLLTIAIPTYNRASYLDLCLARIIHEIARLSIGQRSLVTVYVSDNASEDNTSRVLARYKLLMPEKINVIRNSVNIGPDKNISQCYESATTPYVWVLGDDDVILPGGLQLVLDALANKEIDILYLNGYSFSNHYLDEPKRGRGKSGVVECLSALDFVKHTHVMLTFLTALVVRSGVNVASVSRVVDGTNLTQLGWVLPLVRDGNKFAIIKNRVYAAKIGNSGGYGAIEVFGNNLTKIAKSILKNQPVLVNTIQNGTIVTWFPTYIMSLRKGESVFLIENFASEIKRLFNRNWRYHFFLVPLIHLPLTLAKLYFIFIRLVRKVLSPILI